MFKIYLLSFLFLFTGNIFGQSQENLSHSEHGLKNFRVAINLGHVFIPSALISDKKFAVLPVLGLDVQYWFSHKWGVGLKNDIEIANYFVERDDETILERENPVIVSLPVYFSPWDNGVTFLLGPGIELDDHENLSVFRIGVGYEIEVAHHWDFAPEIVYDLKNGHINAFTIAIGVGKRF
ncbi:hypothetical protein SAMN06265371_101407 [Lutibacter agarilyticus]|uniref:Outer membrane protein beta-barrel domain-containing protein n=1 Tax=Lutibacter agarilyticus TaxID=1109740 RepID=A0A238VIM0_9FLAO|nr:hypothetical protein [Lutibacter agarilyticus]SNR33543.1 hypothetical protein SAMN06265371_101407 [Lutibacter agarilyticus]